MNNKLSKLVLPDFLRQCIHSKDSSGNMLKFVKPESEHERTESLIEDILHWADDGGPMLGDVGSLIATSNPHEQSDNDGS